MNFFRKLFTSKKENEKPKPKNISESKPKSNPQSEQKNTSKVELGDIATNEYFDQRYQEDNISESILEGTLKMIEGYFVANKIKPIIENPINHPKNLDQTIDEGFGFVLYCKASKSCGNFASRNHFWIKNLFLTSGTQPWWRSARFVASVVMHKDK